MQSPRPARLGAPDLGVGVGLRLPHQPFILEHRPKMDWFEIISENFMVAGGMPLHNLDSALETYPLVQHGVSLSIGSIDPLDRTYLDKLKALTRRTKTPWFSDHLCWTGASGTNLHDLLPLPYTEEAVRHVAARIRRVQDFVELPFVLENVSSYMTYTHSTMSEWDFVSAVVNEADCGLLFDVNNIFVSSFNHDFDPMEYVRGIPHHRVVQYHLAGHTNYGHYIIDTHSGHVIDKVWDLYRASIELTGSVSTLIEWDDDIPEWEVLAAEAEKARTVRDEALALRAARAGSTAERSPRAVPTALAGGAP